MFGATCNEVMQNLAFWLQACNPGPCIGRSGPSQRTLQVAPHGVEHAAAARRPRAEPL